MRGGFVKLIQAIRLFKSVQNGIGTRTVFLRCLNLKLIFNTKIE